MASCTFVLTHTLSRSVQIVQARLQSTNCDLYNLILTDPAFRFYNTVKFFHLYYRKFIFVPFLLPHVHPRFSYYADTTTPSQHTNADDKSGNTAFHLACANGSVAHVRRLLDQDRRDRFKSVTVPYTRYNVQAQHWLRLKPANAVCRLVDMVNDEPNTALHYISIIPENTKEEDVLAVAGMLLRDGRSDYAKKGRAGNTALAEAAQHGKLRMVRLVLEAVRQDLLDKAAQQWKSVGAAGVCDNDPGDSGADEVMAEGTVLFSGHHLDANGDECMVNERRDTPLVLANATLATPTSSAVAVPASIARDAADWATVKSQVDAALADYINCKNNYNENAVVMGARSTTPVLDFLLQNGGDPNTSRRDESLIHIVTSGFQLDRQHPAEFALYHAERTIDRRAPDVNAQLVSASRLSELADDDTNGERLGADHMESVLRCLLKHGADAHVAHRTTGMKPLHMAAFWGNTTALEILIDEAKVNPNHERNDRNQWLPIHYACDEGQLWAIQQLITGGASVFPDSEKEVVEGGSGETPAAAGRVMPPSPVDMLREEFLQKKVLRLARAMKQRHQADQAF